MKKCDMLKDSPGRSLFFFALPMILGNLFQQFYNMADSVIVGQCVGEDALAAVGASYSLTTVFTMTLTLTRRSFPRIFRRSRLK